MSEHNDEVTKQGKVTATMSAGKKNDPSPGTQSDPVQVNERPLPARRFQDTNYSKVGITLGLTKSLGNFEFARIDVYAEDFCAPDQKVETLKALDKMAGDYAVKAITDLTSYLNDKKANPNAVRVGM